MARIYPFQPYRYTSAAGPLQNLVTQPYDKISPAAQARYLAQSPYNLVRVILGERKTDDNETDNVYTRAADYLNDWIASGILAQDAEPGVYPYFQEFTVPDSGERLVRKGFIALGAVEDYSANIVHRHEQTLTGPKKDRLELLRHTRAHFGQIFMLYPDPAGEVDTLLAEAAQGAPLLDTLDGDGARHRVWAITNPERTEEIQELMAPKKLLIADGHHRYETALAYRNENPGDPAAEYVMMTFVNMYSPGLKILATHRVLRDMENFTENLGVFQKTWDTAWTPTKYESLDALKRVFSIRKPESIRFGLAAPEGFALLERPRQPGELDVPVLHREILGNLLGIGEEAVREEKYIHYVRGIDAAVAELQHGAQNVFLLEPTPIEDMARIAFSGGVMPQKSTDFYPKLLSGVTIYKL